MEGRVEAGERQICLSSEGLERRVTSWAEVSIGPSGVRILSAKYPGLGCQVRMPSSVDEGQKTGQD